MNTNTFDSFEACAMLLWFVVVLSQRSKSGSIKASTIGRSKKET